MYIVHIKKKFESPAVHDLLGYHTCIIIEFAAASPAVIIKIMH